MIVGTFFGIAVLWDRNKNWPFSVPWPLLSFPNLLAYWVQPFHSIIFQDLKQLNWNSVTPLAFLVVMFCKAHLTSHSRMSGSRWVITPSWLSGSWRSFLYSSSVYSWHLFLIYFASVQFGSVAQSCPTLCDPMNCGTPGLPVHHQLLEFTQTHVHRVDDAIQPSHPLSSPSPPAPNTSQHQGLFQWVNSLHEVAKVLEFQF